jgi:hypothetical protein
VQELHTPEDYCGQQRWQSVGEDYMKEVLGRLHDSVDPIQQVVELEWFAQVVVDTRRATPADILDGVAGCQHQNGRFVSPTANGLRDLKAIFLGQHVIKKDYVVDTGPSELDGFVAILGADDENALLGETLLKKGSHFGIVFDQQDLHLGNLVPYL